MNEHPRPLDSTPHDDPVLRGALDQQGGRVRVRSGLADRAIARDRTQRRNRAGLTALGAGLALAVAVPVTWASRHVGPAPLPVGPTTSTSSASSTSRVPSPSATTAATPTTVPTVLATGDAAPTGLVPLADGPVGSADVAYLAEGVIHDGTRAVPLPAVLASPTDLARTSAGYLVVGSLGQTPGLVVVDPDGGVLATRPGIVRAVVSADGEHVLASDVDGNLSVLDAHGAVVKGLAAATCGCTDGAGGPLGYEAIGITATTAYASRGSTRTTLAWDLGDWSTRALPADVLAVNSVDGSTLVGLTDPNRPVPAAPSALCVELRGADATPRAARWRLCGPLLFNRFTNDGTHLLASGTIDGLPHSQLAPDGSFRYPHVVLVRTADGQVVAEGPRGKAATAYFHDVRGTGPSGALTAVVADRGGRSTVQVCGLDGRCEIVAPPLPAPKGDEVFSPYLLSDN